MSKKPYPKTEQEIAMVAEGGQLIREILHNTAKLAVPGTSTSELNDFADQQIRKIGGRPSFIGYGDPDNAFPAALCTSVNDVVVHGIPSKAVILKQGDIVGLDIGMEYKGMFTDTAITVGVGGISVQDQRLLQVAQACLEAGIEAAQIGNRIGDIGFAIQSMAEHAGFSVVRDLVGHGVGYEVHEDPAVPNYGRPKTGLALEPGMVLAIEPMLNQGKFDVYFADDGWTVKTVDRSRSAHFEHTIVITIKGPKILT